MTKIQNLYILLRLDYFNIGFGHWVLEFGAYLLFGYCNLEFRYYNFTILLQSFVFIKISKIRYYSALRYSGFNPTLPARA